MLMNLKLFMPNPNFIHPLFVRYNAITALNKHMQTTYFIMKIIFFTIPSIRYIESAIYQSYQKYFCHMKHFAQHATMSSKSFW